MKFLKFNKLGLAICALAISMTALTGCDSGEKPDDEIPISNEFSLSTMSFNMKFENITGGGDPIHTWANRKNGIAEALIKYDVAITGTQELQGWQYDELMEILGEKWSGVGLPRLTSDSERSSIIYRNDMIEYIEGETIWLSETPEVKGSKSWGTAHPRIMTYGKFLHKNSKTEFYYFNTHLDHVSALARSKGLELIVSYMDKYSDYPMMLTGDFNMYIESEDFAPLTSRKEDYENTFTPFLDKFGENLKTTHGFNGGTSGKAIDFIFYSVKNLEVISTDIIHDVYENRFYLSDHYPVHSVLKLKDSN